MQEVYHLHHHPWVGCPGIGVLPNPGIVGNVVMLQCIMARAPCEQAGVKILPSRNLRVRALTIVVYLALYSE